LNIHIIVEDNDEELFTADALSFESAVEEIGKLERAYGIAEARAESALEMQIEDEAQEKEEERLAWDTQSLEDLANEQKVEANDLPPQ
jgi:hypothetical protein